MATREEIREGLFKVLFPHSNADHYTGDETVQKVLDYLHSQGVVIKVERKLPFVSGFTDIEPEELDKVVDAFRDAYAGYVATIPLIDG